MSTVPIHIAVCRLPACSGRVQPQLAQMAAALKVYALAQATGVAASQLQWKRSDKGKPLLRQPAGWHFNLSHSRDTAVLAVARQPVGIDVEYADRKANWAGIAQRMFHPQEQAQLQALPIAQQAVRTAQLWTAKEAWAKATGLGVAALPQSPLMQCCELRWQLRDQPQDDLLQARLWDQLMLSLYVMGADSLQLQWQFLNWQDGTFQPLPERPVTELRT